MTAPARGFAPAEFEQRLERAQRAMATGDLDALLLTTEPEVRYFSGFLTPFWLSPTRPFFLVVPAAGKPVAAVPGIAATLMGRSWVDDVRSWDSPRPEDEGVSLVAGVLRELAGTRGRVGLPMGPESVLRLPLADFARLREGLPGLEFVDCGALIRALRVIKSEAEIAKVAHACGVAADAFDAVPALARTGAPLTEVGRRFRIALLERGADDVPYLAAAAGPGGYADVIAPPGERPLNAGDVLMLDTGATFDGYYCDFDRNYALGQVDDATRHAHATLYRATEAGLAAARPGATCSELFRAMQAVIEDAGHACGAVGRLGHGLGMQLTEWPSLTATDATVLAPGMVLTLEPGLAIGPGRGLVHEEDLVVRAGGAELLTRRAPAEPPVID